MEKLLELLEESLLSESLEEARRLVHNIKGSSANIGGMKLSAMAKSLEISASKGERRRLIEALPLLKTTAKELFGAIQREVLSEEESTQLL